MKEITITDDEELREWEFTDCDDLEALLEAFDRCLKPLGLILIVGDRGDDNIWLKIEESEERQIDN